jgi:glycosyltransferase involved in cell wall biosynthesis
MKSHGIILTVHNKAWLIERTLAGIIDNTQGQYNLIIVNDGSTDNSEQVITEYCHSRQQPYQLLFTPDVFETKANNAGLKICETDLVTIVQDDCVITEPGWNLRMQKPFDAFTDVFAVTANCAHNWRINPASQHVMLDHCPDEWSDICTHHDHAKDANTPRDHFVIRNSVNRGPLMLDRAVLEQLDYLDESFAPQDMDDHDLCHRAYSQLGKVCGFYGINFVSDQAWGGTRVNGNTAPWLLQANQKNMKIFYNRHKHIINQNHNETRVI